MQDRSAQEFDFLPVNEIVDLANNGLFGFQFQLTKYIPTACFNQQGASNETR